MATMLWHDVVDYEFKVVYVQWIPIVLSILFLIPRLNLTIKNSRCELLLLHWV